MYFQFPLMVLDHGARPGWPQARVARKRAENLGATTWQYWRYVALPILLPSLLGTMILLFGNAFGAYATAYALTGSFINLVTIVIGAQIKGESCSTPAWAMPWRWAWSSSWRSAWPGIPWMQRRAARWMR